MKITDNNYTRNGMLSFHYSRYRAKHYDFKYLIARNGNMAIDQQFRTSDTYYIIDILASIHRLKSLRTLELPL